MYACIYTCVVKRHVYTHVYIHVCVYVCVCVRGGEKEREWEREREREVYMHVCTSFILCCLALQAAAKDLLPKLHAAFDMAPPPAITDSDNFKGQLQEKLAKVSSLVGSIYIGSAEHQTLTMHLQWILLRNRLFFLCLWYIVFCWEAQERGIRLRCQQYLFASSETGHPGNLLFSCEFPGWWRCSTCIWNGLLWPRPRQGLYFQGNTADISVCKLYK